MSDYISQKNTLKNIGLLSVSVLMGNNKEVDKAIGGYNPSSFLVGLSYGLEQAQAMISSQPTLNEKEIIRKAFDGVVERLEDKKNRPYLAWKDNDEIYKRIIEFVKEECGINE